MFTKMCNKDFCEDNLVVPDQSIKQSCGSIFSWEDKKFTNLTNKTTRMVSGHYELPLPFKNDDTTLPSNRYQALHRVKHLKNKFQRNLTFCRYYKEFMIALMINIYAKKSTDSATEKKMLVYPQSKSLQWGEAQQNKSCFRQQQRISKNITKQWAYVRSGFDQSDQMECWSDSSKNQLQ